MLTKLSNEKHGSYNLSIFFILKFSEIVQFQYKKMYFDNTM